MRKIILMALVLFCSSAAVYASYGEALKLYEAGMYNDSLKMIAEELDISKDLEENSPNYDLRFLAAHNHWKLGNLGPAIVHFKKCTLIKKDVADPLIDLSLMLMDFKRYGDARYFAGKALEIKESAEPYYVLGGYDAVMGRYYAAKKNFEKAISFNPEFGVSYNALGVVLMKLGKFSEANTAFSAALVFLPESAEVLNNIALSLEKTGKNGQALEYLNKAFEKDPNNREIQKNLSRLKDKTVNKQ
ncbi:MAG: tetratricopeptide repeat protein [Spirochaetes bacterium]|nr:tetratricopeptide repeat protein [Spirochaetota bacterium]